jgi:uncharacterized protein YbcV (DUF1398 family)
MTGMGQKNYSFPFIITIRLQFHFYFAEVKFTNVSLDINYLTPKKVKHVRKFKSIISPQLVKFKSTFERN